MKRFDKNSLWEAKNSKMKTFEIKKKTLERRHTRDENCGNAEFCEKKSVWEAKNRKKENFGNKTFQSAELRKCSVLEKNSFWEAKNRKMKTLEIRHSRVQNSGNAAFCKKKSSGKVKIEK